MDALRVYEPGDDVGFQAFEETLDCFEGGAKRVSARMSDSFFLFFICLSVYLKLNSR